MRLASPALLVTHCFARCCAGAVPRLRLKVEREALATVETRLDELVFGRLHPVADLEHCGLVYGCLPCRVWERTCQTVRTKALQALHRCPAYRRRWTIL
jgi:hypothetical protein